MQPLNLDAPVHPGALPGLGLGDLLVWAPVIEELIAAVTRAIAAGGTVSSPPIPIKIHGRHVSLELTATVGP